ncbi:alpha/beta fold hydrolase [Streptomyces sp. NPDC059009]|uniref:alpha/beta fold hydrolase n=1 Tax=Streptomyces sp. NPDC059009 TaxID=3346694 RepID=UPI0036AA2F5C
MRRAAIVFVHGLFSSPATWTPLTDELSRLPDVTERFDFVPFEYSTQRVTWNPLRRMPDINTVADSLSDVVTELGERYERLVLMTHSQGGLVAQRFLSRMLAHGRGTELVKIRRLVMFACPNSGSELFLLARRGLVPLTRNSQERELRPLQSSVVDAQRMILHGVVKVSELSANQCPIPIVSYAGESDNVVAPASAMSLFRETGVLPGDHSGVIRPNKANGRLVGAVRHQLSEALAEPFPRGAGFLAERDRRGPLTVRTGSGTTSFYVHGGPVEQLADVDVIVSSENVYLQMSQFFKASTSGSLRRAAARRGAAGEIKEDVAGDQLAEWLRAHGRYGLPVPEGTVAPTSSGALAAKGVQRIYHAAITNPVLGTNSYHVNPNAITTAVHNVFALARSERAELDLDLSSICLPAFGAGRGGMDVAGSFDLIWDALMSELDRDPSWTIHFTTRRWQNYELLWTRLKEKKAAVEQAADQPALENGR